MTLGAGALKERDIKMLLSFISFMAVAALETRIKSVSDKLVLNEVR